MPPLSPEFRLVCATCRWPRGEARIAAVRAAAADPALDWDRVIAVTKRQRVWGMVANGLAEAGVAAPPHVAEALDKRAQRIARTNLFAAAEVARIGAAFDAAGIDWMCFKGMPLAIEAFGNLTVKMSNDIDLLVPQDQVPAACQVLRDAGYARFSPGPEVADAQIPRWMELCKESGWRHPGNGLIVELHARLMANPALLPQAALGMPRRRIAISPATTVPTMGRELLFAYLVAHGAHHGWFRIKWLVDVAALLSASDAVAIERQYRAAQALGVGRCAAQALLLAHDLLALPLDPAFERELRRPAIHRLLVRIALSVMAGRHEAEEHDGPAARSLLPATFGNLLLRRGIGYKWRELASMAANPVDRATGRLPKGLGFLYPVLGGFRWIRRMTGLMDGHAPARGG
ncbi:nucleotidyltransferase family protein [Sphingomonas canadensis]|uniref:Nucleotidyltransferase family protein n=1 Tax=Sphingomonas canadensis TaxID=1219257 RepID=A0ABW3H9Q4_9SPHN|nr:nucleotidyltransferase family protein [Sphingomonas canadensis]MCW3835384.1 nucleotidyltransferase family protein [Sphingomonas canadensis]